MTFKTLYVLSLSHSCKFVGVTSDFHKRWRRHHSGGVSDWTKRYKPRCVETTRQVESHVADEEAAQLTMQLMLQHGVNKVRGSCLITGRDYQETDMPTIAGCFKHKLHMSDRAAWDVVAHLFGKRCSNMLAAGMEHESSQSETDSQGESEHFQEESRPCQCKMSCEQKYASTSDIRSAGGETIFDSSEISEDLSSCGAKRSGVCSSSSCSHQETSSGTSVTCVSEEEGDASCHRSGTYDESGENGYGSDDIKYDSDGDEYGQFQDLSQDSFTEDGQEIDGEEDSSTESDSRAGELHEHRKDGDSVLTDSSSLETEKSPLDDSYTEDGSSVDLSLLSDCSLTGSWSDRLKSKHGKSSRHRRRDGSNSRREVRRSSKKVIYPEEHDGSEISQSLTYEITEDSDVSVVYVHKEVTIRRNGIVTRRNYERYY